MECLQSMFSSQSTGYDKYSSMFSPEGRLYQVEYAMEAVRYGPLAVGVVAVDGVVLAGEKRSQNTLVDLDTLKKVLLVDDHIGTAIAGLHADARTLIKLARQRSQIFRLNYDEEAPVRSIVVDICDRKHFHTVHPSLRPFGVSLLIGGFDSEGPQLYSTDPSGSYWGWKATAIGKDADIVRDFFKDNYDSTIDVDGAIKLAIQGLEKVTSDDESTDLAVKAKLMEIGKINEADRKFKILEDSEVEGILETL
ncbi:MAG: archaeal proteasome endopeptidase complex subunit alpha [Candidatus Lokiarchaeota archaeon]|nr:archaeal proteasome endopeptidase complex subunit alpha [Candidatus Lokiarchaeota archaeon]